MTGDGVGTSRSIQDADEVEIITRNPSSDLVGVRWIKGREPFLQVDMDLLHANYPDFNIQPTTWIGTSHAIEQVSSLIGTLSIFRVWEQHPGYPESQLENDSWLKRFPQGARLTQGLDPISFQDSRSNRV